MKLTVNENSTIVLREVFNSIILQSNDGEELNICMRDSGFEFIYENKHYEAKNGEVKLIK